MIINNYPQNKPVSFGKLIVNEKALKEAGDRVLDIYKKARPELEKVAADVDIRIDVWDSAPFGKVIEFITADNVPHEKTSLKMFFNLFKKTNKGLGDNNTIIPANFQYLNPDGFIRLAQKSKRIFLKAKDKINV